MFYWRISFMGLCILLGCDSSKPSVMVPTTPLTKDQMDAIAKGDAETCNCGRVLESNEPNGQ